MNSWASNILATYKNCKDTLFSTCLCLFILVTILGEPKPFFNFYSSKSVVKNHNMWRPLRFLLYHICSDETHWALTAESLKKKD